jgi:hypothetical protein
MMKVMAATSIVTRAMRYGSTAVAGFVLLYLFVIPGFLVVHRLRDPALRNGTIPAEAWRLHQYLAPRYERWARARIARQEAATVDYLDVPGTEWPLFGSVFFLWATENLQTAWQRDPARSEVAPAEYARGATEACKDLILDPVHHSWVRRHWGDDYLHQQNVFFRSLVIAGLASYQNLTGSDEYLPMLVDQLDTLSAELDASPYGVLYDYPGECYPIDVFAAVAWIRRADSVAGTDHSAFVERERRAFEGDRLDSRGLIPWIVDPQTGEQYVPSSGIVNSHVLTFAPDLYPDLARVWYEKYEKYFWQETWYGAGFREFARDDPRSGLSYHVDAGPLIGGFSPGANVFGIGAAVHNHRLDHYYLLTTQVLTACWPLLDGRLLGPRLLSDWQHAPYLGEAAVLWQLTEARDSKVGPTTGDPLPLPGGVWAGLALYFGTAILGLGLVLLRVRSWVWPKRVSDTRI